MSARLRWGMFALVCAAQIAAPASMVLEHQRTVAEGSIWKFQTAPVDPGDPFRGRYVRLRFAVEREAVPMADNGVIYIAPDTRMYAELETGADGFAHLKRLQQQRPERGDYLDVFTTRMRETEPKKGEHLPPAAYVRLPFDRWYLPEERAPQVEADYARASRGAQANTYAEARVRAGHAALTALVLDGAAVR